MCGHVSLLCLCLLFVSSSVQGGQENLPSTWTRLVREDAQAWLNEGKEGAEKTLRMFAEQLVSCNARSLDLQTKLDERKKISEDKYHTITQQLATCNSRTIVLQTNNNKLNEEKVATDEKLRIKSEDLANVNSRMLVLQTRVEEKKEGVEQIRQVYAEQIDKLNVRLEEAQKTLITASLSHQQIAETFRADNLRLKKQLEETITNFGVQIERIEGQLAVTTVELKTKTNELTRCDVESTTLREKVKLTTENIEVMNQVLKNQTMDLQQNIFEVILNATNLQTLYVKEVKKQLEQDFSMMNTNVMETVLQNKEDFESTSDKIVQEILRGKSEICKKFDNILQEFSYTKTKMEAALAMTTQGQASNCSSLQSKQNEMLQEIASSKSKMEAGFVKMTQERESKHSELQSKQREILQVIGEMKKKADNAFLMMPKYFSKTQKLNWRDAQKFCRSIGQNLVTIESTAKNQIIKDRMKELGMSEAWIGGTDEAVEDTWRWIGTGQTLTYKNWLSGQPSGGRNENYMLIYNDGTWRDWDVSRELPFICEL